MVFSAIGHHQALLSRTNQCSQWEVRSPTDVALLVSRKRSRIFVCFQSEGFALYFADWIDWVATAVASQIQSQSNSVVKIASMIFQGPTQCTLLLVRETHVLMKFW